MKESTVIRELKQRLAQKRGREYWRSLDELSDTPEFREYLEREFPKDASIWNDPISRREFLKLMGASIAFAGLTSCSRPFEKIVPYVHPPVERMPGVPVYFASSRVLGGYATGVLVESHMGRPTKIEGNPQHPASLGASDAMMQASVLDLYDPDRAQSVTHQGLLSSWDAFKANIGPKLQALKARKGAGLHLLTEQVSSPTLGAQMTLFLSQYPLAKWHQWEAIPRDNAREGALLAFGEDLETRYHFDKAEVILSLDADFLLMQPGGIRYAREFIDGRRVRSDRIQMNRLYVAESTPTPTGAMADHRLPLRSSEIDLLARHLAHSLGAYSKQTSLPPSISVEWLDAILRDLKDHKGRCLIVAGDHQTPAVHALAHAMNVSLGNVGQTLSYTKPIAFRSEELLSSLRSLSQDMGSGAVEMLIICGGNPAFDAPADFDFAARLAKVSTSVRFGLYEDETSEKCHWHLPESHFLESWGDARAFDGTASLIQPLIAPLYDTKSINELIDLLTAPAPQRSYELVRSHWKSQYKGLDFEAFWRKSLHDGVIQDSAYSTLHPVLQKNLTSNLSEAAPLSSELELSFRPDPCIWDGRFANNGWLQELPKPLNKLTWDNAVLIAPETAKRLNLETGRMIELKVGATSLRAAVWVETGQARDNLTLHLGYGRSKCGRIGSNTGFDAYRIRSSDALWLQSGVEIKRLNSFYKLASTQIHHSMEGQSPIRALDIAQFRQNPRPLRSEEAKSPPSLYPQNPMPDADAGVAHAWGMSIDLNACIGCNACVLGCQSENNIPIVGKSQVLVAREMHWIRIDQYYSGNSSNPKAYFQPVLCMHCEKAPCELVCPVNATVHDAEGLNDMVYNRCVGTRYCSNNCPYKVRRFNFLEYNHARSATIKMLHNPDVSVRSKGVMEKCTYCIQRITAARINAEKQNRTVQDGEVVTACQQACPTQAIVFGNIRDESSQVSKLKHQPLDYGLLEDLGTRPRTTYLAHLNNPNPKLSSR